MRAIPMAAKTNLPEVFPASIYLDKELGELTPRSREVLRQILGEFMQEVRAIFGGVERCNSQQADRCHTCAFNPETDADRGFIPTAYGLLVAFRDFKVFLCHRNQPEHQGNLIMPEKAIYCEGFRNIVRDPIDAAYFAAWRTAERIRKAVPENRIPVRRPISKRQLRRIAFLRS